MQFLYNENREAVAEKDYSGNIIRYIRGLGLISSDSENAKTYYHYEYDAFGNTISCEERVANRFRYQGEQYDPVTRQYYLRARYYNPVIGRFTQEDTYYGDGLNLYEYCRNNTITYKDPTGHNICATQRDLYHKYREEGMNPQEAYQKMRKDLGLDSKSGYKDSGVGNGNDPWRSYESGNTSVKTDFYVKPNGEIVPATGYRYMPAEASYMDSLKNTMEIPANPSGTYITFDKFDVPTPGRLQVPHDASIRGSFDTLQIIDDIRVPNGKWGQASWLEPITKDFPKYGSGGATQALTYQKIKLNSIKDLSR